MTDDKDKTFTEIMHNPNEKEISTVWRHAQDLAIKFEDEHGFKRDVVIEGLLEAALDLATSRYDKPTHRHMNDTRRMYLVAYEKTKRRLDRFPDYATQRAVEDEYGKDQLYFRNAKNFGWKPPEEVLKQHSDKEKTDSD